MAASREAWDTWFRAWFAVHWTTADLPMLRQLIRLFDIIERGSATSKDRTELRQLLETYGITPKGQQDRRWKAPEAAPKAEATAEAPRYAGVLKAVR